MEWKESHPDFVTHKDLLGSPSAMSSSKIKESLGKYPTMSTKRKDFSVDLSFISSLIHPEEND